MNSPFRRTSVTRMLGIAFLIQAIGSIVGVALQELALNRSNIGTTLVEIGASGMLLRVSNLALMITAVGLVMLGATLYALLHHRYEPLARLGFGLYLLEAGLLAASTAPLIGLLLLSREPLSSQTETMAHLLVVTSAYADTLHMLAFGIGASLFYALLHRSGYLPRWLSIIGLVAAPLSLAGTLLTLLGTNVPLFVHMPNGPFELGMGIWMLVKGISAEAETTPSAS